MRIRYDWHETFSRDGRTLLRVITEERHWLFWRRQRDRFFVFVPRLGWFDDAGRLVPRSSKLHVRLLELTIDAHNNRVLTDWLCL